MLRRAVAGGLAVALLSGTAPEPGSAQTWSSADLSRVGRTRAALDLQAADPRNETVLEAPVDPERYVLVPGDQLILGVWGESPETYRSAITPDGHLVVPDLVGIEVAGLTLAESERRVRSALRSLYPEESIRLHLFALGRFRVGVAGAVVSPGFYELTGAHRLSDLLALAGGLRPEAGARRIQIRSTPSPLAALEMGGPGGSEEVDLSPWSLRADPDANPPLRPGMVVEVPVREVHVEVGGAVAGAIGGRIAPAEPVRPDPNRPAEPEWIRVEWQEGDRVADALALAGGLGEAASGSAVLFEHGERIPLDLRDPSDLERPVGPFARLEVEHATRWVYVVGAVRVPGRYPFYAGLGAADYVLLAGGETENGRTDGWKLVLPDGRESEAAGGEPVVPGSTLRVPERRSYWLTRTLAPLTSTAALIVSIVALSRR